MSAGISGSYTVLSAPTISSVSRAISSGAIADARAAGSAAAGFASVLVSSVIASSEQILRLEQRLRKEQHRASELLTQDFPDPPRSAIRYDDVGRHLVSKKQSLSLPQIKFECIDGVILRGTVSQLCCQLPGLLAEPVHPCSATSACELHCNISDTIRAGGEDAARQTQLHSPSNPACSSESGAMPTDHCSRPNHRQCVEC